MPTPSSTRPGSRSLYRDIRARIGDGSYAAGTALPSTRSLAAERGLSRGTVSLVYEQLAADGFVDTRAGAATRVAAMDMTSKYQVLNPQAIKRLVANKTQLKMFPKALMDAGFKASMEVFAEHEAKSPEFKKIHQDMRAFQRDQILWNRFSEFPFNQYMATAKI